MIRILPAMVRNSCHITRLYSHATELFCHAAYCCHCRAIGMMMFTLLWPIWPFLMQIALVVYWGATCVYLASTAKQVYQTTNSSLLGQNGSFSFRTSTTPAATVNYLFVILVRISA